MGVMVPFAGNGETYEGYLAAAPEGGPGVIVLQEWWGLVGHIKSVADRFAAAGFTALAPDLYRGHTTSEPDEAGSLMMALNIADTEKILRGAVQALLDHPSTTGDKVGVVGFCMGGQLSMFAACASPDQVGACVNFYGIHPNVKPDFAALQAPLLGLFATRDAYASPKAVQALDQELSRLGKAHEFVTYEADHAFFNDDRPAVFNAEAAEDAWSRTLSHFRRYL